MHDGGESMLQSIMDKDQPIKNYQMWKDKRKKIATTYGLNLLSFSESELISEFSKIETQLNQLLLQDNTNMEQQLLGLLYFSILHLFHKSYDRIKYFFPAISNLISSRSREVCRAACRCLRFLAEESPDNISFLRESLNTASTFLKKDKSGHFIFNELTILREVGRFLPTDVFGVTCRITVEIWAACCSSDKDLRAVAVKVYSIHLQNQPINAQEFAKSSLHDCMETLKSNKNEAYDGIILICMQLYRLFPRIFDDSKTIQLRDQLLHAASISNPVLLTKIYQLVVIFCKDKPSIFKPKANEFLMILVSQVMRGVGTSLPQLLSKIVNLLQIFNQLNYEGIMIQGVIDLVSFISPMQQYQKFSNDIFALLLTVFKLYKTANAPPSVFLKATPCDNYLQVIRLRPGYLKDLRNFLMEQFGKGIQAKASPDEQIVSIIMVRLFDKLLFDVGPPLFEMLIPFCDSPNPTVRRHMTTTLGIFKSVEANSELMRMALLDDNEKVRSLALKQINPEFLVQNTESITQLLVDPSFEVRKLAIPVIASSANYSALIRPIIIVFLNDFFASNVAHTNPSRSADACSLLPHITKYFLQFSPSFLPLVAWICLKFLLHGDQIPETAPGQVIGQWEQLDIRNTPHHNIIADNFAPLSTITERDVNRLRVYQVENEKHLEKRDSYLFETLGNIPKGLMPYILQVVPVFIKTFRTKHTKLVYITATKALTKIVRSSESYFNFLVVFPDLLSALLNLLSDDETSHDLAIEILKLIGTIGASNSNTEESQNEEAVEHLFAVKSPSFFTSFVMSSLVELIKKESIPAIFKTITTIFVNETNYAIPFLKNVIPPFMQSIEHEPGNDDLWQQMELICYHCESYVFPFLEIMKPILIDNLKRISCIRLCIVLSYHLKIKFIDIATSLYPIALHLIDTNDLKYFKSVLKLITFSIIFQNQCTDLFIVTCEKIINGNCSKPEDYEQKVTYLMNSISLLIQLTQMAPYSARIVRMGLKAIGKIKSNSNKDNSNENDPSFDVDRRNDYVIINNEALKQTLYNLCIFGFCDPLLVSQEDEHYEDLINAMTNSQLYCIDELPFIKKLYPKPSTKHLKNVIPPIPDKQKNEISADDVKWQFNNRQWLEDICQFVVVNNPSLAIRSCAPVVGQSQAFRTELLPIAFLAWWKDANDESKQILTKIIKTIFSFDNVDPQVISLLNIVDRAGFPPDIADSEIAKRCSSTSMSLYFFQRHLKKNPDDTETLQNLLALNSRMGRINSARGLLASMADKLDKSDIAKWSAQLGEWEKALEIYESLKPPNITALIECYAKLELWDKVRESAPEFVTMEEQDKENTALCYAWAFYHVKKFNNVEFYLKKFPYKNDLNVIHFKSMYLIAQDRYEEANAIIQKGFELLTDNLSVFNGSDTNEASRRMVFAQHLIELLEVLELKQTKVVDSPIIWQNRLKNFSHESESWMKLIEIRSLVLSPAGNSESYLKMLSVLRKERKWKLIDVYCDRFFSKTTSIPVILSRLKILWNRGKKREAVTLICALNKVFNSSTEEEAIKSFEQIKESDKIQVFNFFGIANNNSKESLEIRNKIISKFRAPDKKMAARFLRIQANWQYSLYTSKTSSAQSLLDICKVFEESMNLVGNDYRTFSGWAYANSRALSHFVDKRSKIALDAMFGFLRATQLRPSESLEFLCQFFSIYFRFGEEFTLPDDLRSQITQLPAAILHQIIPQIVVHIAHKDPKISNVVQSIISEFGSSHFQAVVFPLNVLSLLVDDDSENNDNNESSGKHKSSHHKKRGLTKAMIARDMMNKLGSLHPKVYADACLLIDGMHRSAVTWTEQWLTALDTASRAQQMNDRDSVIKLIQTVFDLVEKPNCELDNVFKRYYGASLQRCRMNFEKYKMGPDPSVHRAMWDGFRAVYAEMDSKIKKMDNVQLSKVSEELANMRKFDLSIPGTYSVDQNSPQLDYIDPTLKVLNSQQHPRAVHMCDVRGNRYKFLLKGNEDLRLDQRIMQFFNLINSLLKNNRNTADLKVSIIDYAIVPFAPNAGLITWVTGADTFQQLVTDYRVYRDIHLNVELEIAQQFSGGVFNSLSALQRYEVFTNVAKETDAIELREMLWLRSPDASSWLQRSTFFTISTALMSMAGYTIGLGDRHPSNIMVQRHTGRCLHIDFGDSFEVAMNRPAFSERVPFRMTRMMVNALDMGCVDGMFRTICEDVLWVLRESQSSIIALMEVFVHEPIFYGKEIRPSTKAQKGILERVAAKLKGNDPAPYDNPDIIYEVGQQVDTLIKKASDPHEYVRHYVGWCPFW